MIKVGIVGTGGMAHDHARNYRTMKNVQMTACCDIVEERVRDFAKRFNIPRRRRSRPGKTMSVILRMG
jgi:predicted dehydrogenase